MVPELGGLGYFVKYPSPPSSSTKLGKIGDGLGGLSSIFNLPSMVLELDGLGYFTKYPSPPSSGTIVGHQVPCGSGGPLNY